MKNLFTFFILASFSLPAQIPPNYYDAAGGYSGQTLRLQLYYTIRNHSVVPTSSVLLALEKTDAKPNGKVWDIFGYQPSGPQFYEYDFNTMACGVYTVESDCYDIAYAWPKAWFNNVTGANSDLFNIYPADGFVNSKRANYPFGTAGTSSYLSMNWSKLGMCSDNGYGGTVFEPINDIKGDIARSYFYMTTRYFLDYGGWGSSPATNNAEILPWQLTLLMFWHHWDPVSLKEIQKNDSIYKLYQHNRNPFIDHPEFAYDIWSAYIGLKEQQIEGTKNYMIYPNPTVKGQTQIAGLKDGDKIEVYNALGQLMLEANTTDIDLSAQPQGIYLLKVKSSGYSYAYKLINNP